MALSVFTAEDFKFRLGAGACPSTYTSYRARSTMTVATKDTRLRCRFCSTVTWSPDYKKFMEDHDRPDGKRCRRAQEEAKQNEQTKL